MRNILLSTFLLLTFITQAQFNKGDKVLGGTFSFNFQNSPNNQYAGVIIKSNAYAIEPSFGFLLTEHFAVGAQLGYTSSYQKSTDAYAKFIESTSKTYTAGIYVQRYFKISDNFLFSIIGLEKYGLTENSTKITPNIGVEFVSDKTHSYQLSTTLMPNFIFFPSTKWGFSASIGSVMYEFSNNMSKQIKQHAFNVNYGTLTLGLSYYFR